MTLIYKSSPPARVATIGLLVPTLYNLSGSQLRPDDFHIPGLDHAPNDDAGWKQALTDTMQGFYQG